MIKKILFAIILFFSFQISQGQIGETVNYADVDIVPEFVGGGVARNKFLSDNFKLPEHDSDLNGKITIKFIIEIDGQLTNFKVVEDVGLNSGTILIDVLKKSPKWVPGELNGVKVRVNHFISLKIKS